MRGTIVLNTVNVRVGWLRFRWNRNGSLCVRRRPGVERRASNKGCLSLGLGDYLQLLDWPGRQIRSDKRSAMPANLDPLFERLGISTELWVDCVVNFRKWFRASIGRPKSTENAAVNFFVEKYSDRITGVISCFDRMLFKGYLQLGWAEMGAEPFLDNKSLLHTIARAQGLLPSAQPEELAAAR